MRKTLQNKQSTAARNAFADLSVDALKRISAMEIKNKVIYFKFFFTIIFSTLLLKSYSITDALKLKIQNSTHSDETVIRFLPTATTGFDSGYDAWKMFSSNPLVPSIYTRIDSVSALSINALPSLVNDLNVPLYIKVGATDNYTIIATEIGTFAGNINIILEDTQTGYTQDLRTNASYTINVTDTAIFNATPNRFIVHFSVQVTTSLLSYENTHHPLVYISYNVLTISHSAIMDKVQLYTIDGKLLFDTENINQLSKNIEEESNKVMLLIIFTKDKVFKQKIVNR